MTQPHTPGAHGDDALGLFLGLAGVRRDHRAGDWNHPATWGGAPPQPRGRAWVAGDVAVGDEARVGLLYVGGSLAVRGRLSAGTLAVAPSGRLTLEPGSELLLGGCGGDPASWAGGLVCHGALRVRGEPKAPFVRLAAPALPQDDALRLEAEPLGWRPGDRLAICPTGGAVQYYERRPVSYCTVRSVTRAGGSWWAVLTGPVGGLHDRVLGRGGREPSIPTLPHAVNLTRSVRVASADPDDPGHLACVGAARPDVRFAAFANLGRAALGRYPLHLHLLEGGSPDYSRWVLEGNVVEGSPSWGVVLHGSHCGAARGNVAVACRRAGFVTEDGSESWNVVEGNLALWCGFAEGEHGAGFWLNGHRNWFRGNVACLCGTRTTGAGYYFPPSPHPSQSYPVWNPDGSFDPRFAPHFAEMPEFRDNESYCNRHGVHYDHTAGGQFAEPRGFVERGFRSWGGWGGRVEGVAAAAYDGSGITYEGMTTVGERVDVLSNVSTALLNCDVDGVEYAVLDLSHNGLLAVRDCVLRGRDGVRLRFPYTAGTGPLPPPGVPLRETLLEGVRYDVARFAVILDDHGPDGQPSKVPVALVRVTARGHGGPGGPDYRLYHRAQAAGAVCPAEADLGADWPFMVAGAPERGLANAEAAARWVCRPRYDEGRRLWVLEFAPADPPPPGAGWAPVCVGGEVAPAGAAEVAGVSGLAAPLGGGRKDE